MTGALLLLSAVVAQAPTVGVTLSSARPGAEALTATALARAEQALAAAGVPGLLTGAETKKRLLAAGYSDPKKCGGGRKCLRDLALILGGKAVLVGIDVARVADEVVVHVEAVAANRDGPLAVGDATVRLKGYADALVAPLTVFARSLKEKLPAAEVRPAEVKPVETTPAETVPIATTKPPPEKESDRPVAEVQPETTPAPKEPEVDPLAPEVQTAVKGTKVAGVITGAGALVAGALAVTFAVLAANDQARWEASRYQEAGQTGTTMTAADADALVAQGNTRFSVALGLGVGAGALGVTAIILLTQ